MKKRRLSSVLSLFVILTLTGCATGNFNQIGTNRPNFNQPNQSEEATPEIADEPITVAGTYQNVVESFDWGPGVTKLIIHLEKSVVGDDTGKLDASAFDVATTRMSYTADRNETLLTEKRILTNAYTCDSGGNQISNPSEYIALEMSASPNTGSPFFYNYKTNLHEWSNPYEQEITLTKELSTGSEIINSISLVEADVPGMLVQAGKFKVASYTYGTGNEAKTLKYAFYEAKSKAHKNGLVVWLHDLPDGGTDPRIALLGNKVANLASSEIQTALKGADILVAQCPDKWMNYKTGIDNEEYNTADLYESKYTEALKGLIESYLSSHPNVDENRIYIGGASTGGSMAMNMILNYPDYFAAAFFASEGYADRFISDEQIEMIKYIPMWFVYAQGDTLNEPARTAQATFERLATAKAKDVRLSYFDEGVVDTTGEYVNEDGSPYRYNSHWTWIYLLNNECMDNNISLMSWLGSQTK